MTAPDPLECLNSRAAAGPNTCGEPASAHCTSCGACSNPCACPPLPAVGTQVLPKPGLRTSNGLPVRPLPHVVVATWDHRRTGEPADHVVVVQLTNLVRHAVAMDQPINTEYGAHLGLDDFAVLPKLPRITFTAKENS